VVFRGNFCGQLIAAKKIQAEDDDERNNSLREVLFGAMMAHPNILTVSNWAEGEYPSIYLVMPLIEPGSLKKVMKSMPEAGPGVGGRLGWVNLFRVLIGCANALEYMASCRPPVIHRDMKPDNILVTQDFHPKITDFGLAKRLDLLQSQALTMSRSAVCGTPVYMCPEALQGQRTTVAADMYSFGCIMWELLHDVMPRHECATPVQVELAVVSHQKKLPCDPSVPQVLQDLISECLNFLPTQRPAASNVRERLTALARSMGIPL
jgi:serine/threonine protein kinase